MKTVDICIIGGGLVGIKTADALADKGIKVSLLEISDRLMPYTADSKTSEIISDILKSKILGKNSGFEPNLVTNLFCNVEV